MKTLYQTIVLLTIVLLIPSILPAQGGSGQQSLQLQVIQMNKIGLTTPSVYMVIDNPPKEGDIVVTSNTDGSLLWTTNGENRKISVTSNQSSSLFTLKVLAENLSQLSGTAGPEVTLDDEQDHNLILGVSKTAGRCVLRLTAISNLLEGVGSESRVLTYTIMNN